MKEKLFLPVILFLTFLVWAPTLGTYFSQDDWVFLSHVYKQPFSAVFKHYQEAFYRPAGQQLFFYLGSRMFGLEAQGFHLLGLLIHLFNVWLLSKILNIWSYPSTRTPRGWLKGTKRLGNGAFGAGFRPDRLEDAPHLAAGRPHDRRVKYFLLTFYAVNPAHLVALNWLTQMDIEIAVGLALVSTYLLRSNLGVRQGWTFLDVIKKTGGLILFLFGVLSHEVVVFLPVAWWLWFKQKKLTIIGLATGLALIGAKFLANPFSSQGDYRVLLRPMEIFSTIRWYVLRALAIPEGIRSLPAWLIILSLIPGLILILMFRQKLARGLGIYLLGVLPVLGFGGHLLAAYAIFGISLMAIELGKNQQVKQKFSYIVLLFAVVLPSALFIHFNVLKHWSTGRGLVSARLANSYIGADSDEKKEIIVASADFANNSEIYFSTMFGKQFEVLDRGVSRGMFDVLFYRGNDLTTQFLPDAEFFRNSILAGKFPAWNPWIFAGMPYFLDPQNFLWYPPNYIFLLVLVETGFLLLLIGHLGLAGWGVKRVLGEFGVFGKFALLGVGMFVLSPKLVGHIEEGNWTLAVAACWLPILYLALKKSKFWWIVISLSAIIINNLNMGYYAGLFVMFYFLTHASLKRTLLASARRVLIIFLATALLTIPRWLPLVIFGGETVRANLQEAPLPLWSWTKVAKSLVFPLARGHPVLQNEEILYLGLASVLLVLLGILGKLGKMGFRKRVSLFWFAWLTFIFFVALNNKTPLFYLIRWLPGFSLMRITTRPWIFVALGVALGVPIILDKVWRTSKILGFLGALVILGEFGLFGYGIFSRREIISDSVPAGFYRQMAGEGNLVRAYCTTGCLDRLTAQRMGIALLGGNNPIQLKSFVEYLQQAGGYKEQGYHPILPPYTVFNQQPQPKAELLAKTATKFVVSPYELTDENFKLVDQQGDFRLYQNTAESRDVKDHYFELETIKML